MAGEGKAIAGAGTDVPIKDVDRLVSQYGGEAGDWSKVTSRIFTARDGTKFAVHAYENSRNGLVVELKTKLLP